MNDVLPVVPIHCVHNMILAHVSSIDHSIQFTVERKEGGRISFLDVAIIHNLNRSPSTKVYHQPTHTGRYLQYFSQHLLAVTGQWSQLWWSKLPHNCWTEQMKWKEVIYEENPFFNGYPKWFFTWYTASKKESLEKKDPKAYMTVPYV